MKSQSRLRRYASDEINPSDLGVSRSRADYHWQAWMQKTKPKLMVVWGKHDLSFDPGEPERYHKDDTKVSS